MHGVATTQQPTETVPQNTKRHSFVTANRTSRSGKGNALCSRANGAYFGRPAWLNVFEPVNSPVPSKGTLTPPRPWGQEPSVTITKWFSLSASEPVSRLPTVITVWTTLKRVARLQGCNYVSILFKRYRVCAFIEHSVTLEYYYKRY